MSQINGEFPLHCEERSSHQENMIKSSFLPYNMPGTTLPLNESHYYQTSVPRNNQQLINISEPRQVLPSPYASLYSGQPPGHVYPQSINPSSYLIGNPPSTHASVHQTITSEHAFQNESKGSQPKISPSKPVPIRKANKVSELPPPHKLNQNVANTKKRKETSSVDDLQKINAIKSYPKLNNNVGQTTQRCETDRSNNTSDSNSTSNTLCGPTSLMYPAHFMKGSIIQLAQGQLKRVEDMKTEDFIDCTKKSSNLKIDSSTVVKIMEKNDTAKLSFSVGVQKIQVTVEAAFEHPFYVFGQGWSSCSPAKSMQRYGLLCKKLVVGDVCISLTQKSDSHDPPSFNLGFNSSDHISQRKFSDERSSKSKSVPIDDHNIMDNKNKKRRWSAPEDVEKSNENQDSKSDIQ